MQFDQLKRCEFIALVGGAAAAWPLAALAQQTAKLPPSAIWVQTLPRSRPNGWPLFVQRLQKLGWIEGRTIAIEVRWPNHNWEERQ